MVKFSNSTEGNSVKGKYFPTFSEAITIKVLMFLLEYFYAYILIYIFISTEVYDAYCSSVYLFNLTTSCAQHFISIYIALPHSSVHGSIIVETVLH